MRRCVMCVLAAAFFGAGCQTPAWSGEPGPAAGRVQALLEQWERAPVKNTLAAQQLADDLARLGSAAVPGIAAALPHACARNSLATGALLAALVRLKAAAASPRLVKLLCSSPGAQTRINLAAALGEIGAPGAIPELLNILDEQNPAALRRDPAAGRLGGELIRALQCLGRTFEGAQVLTAELSRRMFSALPDAKIRYAEILRQVPGRQSEYSLVMLLADSSPQVRAAALSALAAHPSPRIAAQVLPSLASGGSIVKIAAARTLGEFKYLPAVLPLIPLLASQERGVPQAALWALRRITGMGFAGESERWASWHKSELARERLCLAGMLAGLESAPAELKPLAVEQFAGLALLREDAARALRPYAEHADLRVRAAVCNVLAQSGGPQDLQLLAARLNDSAPEVAHAAWRGLRYATDQDLPPDAERWNAFLRSRNQ